MTDIFDNVILCNKCKKVMKRKDIEKNGFVLRQVECLRCGSRIVHPLDEQELKKFDNLKKKEFNVKMRIVGNSYAVSIPKEIVSFMKSVKEHEKMVDDMVRLCFEDMGRLSLNFNSGGFENE